MKRSLSAICKAITGLVVLAGALAQGPTGTIAGLVTDPTRSTVAQARVVVRNVATGLSRAATTTAEGSYSVPSLPAGSYEVTAEAAGFSMLTRTTSVEVGTTTTVNFDMQVGATTDTVTVN